MVRVLAGGEAVGQAKHRHAEQTDHQHARGDRRIEVCRQVPALDARLDLFDDVLFHFAGEREALVLAADARH